MATILPPKPTDRPQWTATNPDQRVVPTPAFREVGWNANERPPAEFMNWLFFNIGVEWLDYFDTSLSLLEGSLAGNIGQFDGVIGVEGTDATIPDFIARVRAINADIEDQRVFVIDPQTITSTQLLDMAGLEVVFHPRAIIAQAATLQVGLRIDAPRVKIINGRFIGFNLVGGSAIDLTSNAINARIDGALFSENTENITGTMNDTIISNTSEITI